MWPSNINRNHKLSTARISIFGANKKAVDPPKKKRFELFIEIKKVWLQPVALDLHSSAHQNVRVLRGSSWTLRGKETGTP